MNYECIITRNYGGIITRNYGGILIRNYEGIITRIMKAFSPGMLNKANKKINN